MELFQSDDKKLARKNRTVFDEAILFNEALHQYKIKQSDGTWVCDGVTSVSTLLKTLHTSQEEELDKMAKIVYFALHRKIQSFNAIEINAAVVEVEEDSEENATALNHLNRSMQVTLHISEEKSHATVLKHIIASLTDEEQYYDELFLHLVEKGSIRIDSSVPIVQYKMSYSESVIPLIREFWSKTALAGTKMHLKIENFLNDVVDVPVTREEETIQDRELEEEVNRSFARWRHWYLEKTNRAACYGKIFRTELKVGCAELKLCGSIDAVFYDETRDEYTLVDWKRVKDVKKCNIHCNARYGKIDGRFVMCSQNADNRATMDKYPFSFNSNSNSANAKMSKCDLFELQLGLYKYLFENGDPLTLSVPLSSSSSSSSNGRRTKRNVTRLVLVVVSPRKSDVEVIEFSAPFVALNEKIEAIVNKRKSDVSNVVDNQ